MNEPTDLGFRIVMMRIRNITITLAIISLLYLAIAVSQAQQTETSPTPAPTKTPSAESTSETESTEETIETSNLEPFTQADLQVLVGNVQRPNGIAWFDGNLYTACNGDWTLYEINDTTGSTRTFIYGVRNAHSLYVEQLENSSSIDLWVPDYDTNSLLSINANRAPRAVTSELEGPWGIAYLNENEFLITNLAGDNLAKVNRTGSIEVLNDELRAPAGLVVTDEYVFVTNNGSARQSIVWGRVEDIESEDLVFEPLVNGLQNTTGLVLADDGFLYFTYALGTRGVVGRIKPELCLDGGCSNDQVEIVLYTDLPAPLAGLAITPDMRLFVHTIYRPEIYWVDLASEQ